MAQRRQLGWFRLEDGEVLREGKLELGRSIQSALTRDHPDKRQEVTRTTWVERWHWASGGWKGRLGPDPQAWNQMGNHTGKHFLNCRRNVNTCSYHYFFSSFLPEPSLSAAGNAKFSHAVSQREAPKLSNMHLNLSFTYLPWEPPSPRLQAGDDNTYSAQMVKLVKIACMKCLAHPRWSINGAYWCILLSNCVSEVPGSMPGTEEVLINPLHFPWRWQGQLLN